MRADLPHKKVLVVDDAPAVMQSLVLVLRLAGFDAAGEIGASAALHAAQAHHPDILLCDIQLGITNGVELSLDIATLLPGCRIILMSGDTTSAKILAEAHERGQDFEVLAKPMLPQELLALLGPASPAANASGNTMAGSKFMERRSEQRIRFESPATVAAGHHSIAASAKDITERGLFFFTDARIELGSEIDIVITLPEEVGLPLSGMVCCHGHVVRSNSGGGQCGVAVQIDRLASVPQA
jgi:DNA-binding NarL/FixJ family response regulator